MMNLNFVRGGVTLYQTTQYAGYVGLLTGMRKDGFAISVDTRFDSNLDKFLLAWLMANTMASSSPGRLERSWKTLARTTMLCTPCLIGSQLDLATSSSLEQRLKRALFFS